MMPPRRKTIISLVFKMFDGNLKFVPAVNFMGNYIFAPLLLCFSNLTLNWLSAEVGQRLGQSKWCLYIDSYSMF